MEKIELVCGPAAVYNFEVDKLHSYYVAGNQVLVHNKSDDEMGKLLEGWEKSSFDTIGDSFAYHVNKHAQNMDMLTYLRKAHNFRKKEAHKTILDDGTIRYKRKSGETLWVNKDGKIVSYDPG